MLTGAGQLIKLVRPYRMKLLVAFLCASIGSSLLLQGYLAIWSPSSFGAFAELPVILLYASFVVVPLFFAVALPTRWWLQRYGIAVRWPLAVLVGGFLGALIMSLFLWLIGWPLRIPELIAGAFGGGIGLGVYAALSSASTGAKAG